MYAMFGPIFTSITSTAPGEMSTTVVAIVQVTANLLAYGVSPFVIGLLTDLMGGGVALGNALTILASFALPAGLLFFWCSRASGRLSPQTNL